MWRVFLLCLGCCVYIVAVVLLYNVCDDAWNSEEVGVCGFGDVLGVINGAGYHHRHR